MKFIYTSIYILRGTFKAFVKDEAYIHGAALAYYTIFSLPPMLMIIVSSLGFFLGQDHIKNELLSRLDLLLGKEPTRQVEYMLEHLLDPYDSFLGTFLGIGILLFSSTLMFYSMRNALNTFWKVKKEVKSNILIFLWDRLLAFLMVLFLGVILLISLLANTVLKALGKLVPEFPSELLYQSEGIVSIGIIFLVFSMLFKYLPNARIRFRDAFRGGLFTTILFLLGDIAISYYIASSNFKSTYGAGGSLIVILAWVFYSSQIFFLGAEYIYVYTQYKGRQIKPLFFSKKPEKAPKS